MPYMEAEKMFKFVFLERVSSTTPRVSDENCDGKSLILIRMQMELPSSTL